VDIDRDVAKVLGFHGPAYTAVERERRWLCRDVPLELVVRTETIVDLYVTDARLRLREARPQNGDPPRLRLTRKGDVDARRHLVTSIYLPEEEFRLLARVLPGDRLHKRRHRLKPIPGIVMSVDEFEGTLAGLTMVEAEFETDELMASFSTPAFASREVTDDPRYSGALLARKGRPG
jgi:CYTH domain-containing protein